MFKSSVFTASLLVALGAANIATADDSKPAPNEAAKRTCLHPGAGINLKPDQCSTFPGRRSISKEEMDLTGRSTVGGALRDLDPTLTIR